MRTVNSFTSRNAPIILFCLVFLFSIVQATCALGQSIFGPITALDSSTQTYSVTLPSYSVYSFVVSGGNPGTPSKTPVGGSQFNYSVGVHWTATGPGVVTFVGDGTARAALSVTVCNSTTPAPTASGFTYVHNCGNTVITRSSNPPAGVTWYWQTTSTGQSTANSGTSFTVTGSQTYYLTAVSLCSVWSTSGQATASVVTNSIPGAASVTGGASCGPGSVSLSATGAGGTSTNWYTSISGGSPISGAGPTYSPTVSSTTVYYVTSHNVTTGCESATRTAVAATINVVPGTPTATDGFTCGSGTVNLSGTAGTNATTLNWYDSPLGGTPFASHVLNYTTPSLSVSAGYYIASVSSAGCESTRIHILATINPIPPAPTGIPGNSCLPGPVSLDATPGTGGSSVAWYAASTGGTAVFTGHAFPTPSISATTTYYAQTITPCNSATRTAVVATIDQGLCMNTLQETTYKEDGTTVIADGITYSDGLGRTIQSQALDVSSGKIFATQPLYDTRLHAAATTLSAPTLNTTFAYLSNFVQNQSNQSYSATDFDAQTSTGASGEPTNPKPVGAQAGTLGWYYSSSNTLEPFTPTTTYPYARSYMPAGPDPVTGKSGSAGDAHRLGAGHESKGDRYLIASGELSNYYTLRSYFTTTSTATGLGYKYISTDPDGKRTATFVDADGHTVATALVVSSTGTPPVFTYDIWSYTYYNDAGQVTATVPPNGVASGTTPPSFVTYYYYDHKGQLIKTISPDEGTSQFVYSTDGKIRFSQNQEQYNASPKRFSYTNYDYLGRLIESGEYTQGSYVFEPASTTSPAANSILNTAILDNTGFSGTTNNVENTACTDVTRVYYDAQQPGFHSDGVHTAQTFLSGNVSMTATASDTTWYSYDEDDNLIWSVQSIAGLGKKTIDYTTDYLGNLTQVAFQAGQADAFYHHYTFDADQRLSTVSTSKDGVTQTLQATYYYYLHGPLKRVELAGNLQGIDYVYNINGSLKSINNVDTGHDPGTDGSGAHAAFKADAFGMILDYYPNDYQNANFSAGSTGLTSSYSGLIKSMSWTSPVEMPATKKIYGYSYDNRNQLTGAEVGSLTGSPGSYITTFSPSLSYNESVSSYDKNGNINALSRNDKSGTPMAAYTYNYATSTNKLSSVTNATTGTSQCVSCAQLHTQITSYVSTYTEDGLANIPQLVSYLNSALSVTYTDQQYQAALKTCNLTYSFVNDEFNGWITFGNQPQYKMHTGDFTIEAWVNLSNGYAYYAMPILGNEINIDCAPDQSGFYLSLFQGTAQFMIADGVAYGIGIYTTGTLSLNAWHLVTATRHINQIAVYFDGVYQTPIQFSGHFTTLDLDLHGERDVKIGKGAPDCIGPTGLQGYIRQVRLYTRLLDGTEIAANASAGYLADPTNTSNLVLWAPLDDGAGTTVRDQSPYHQAGTFEGTDIGWGDKLMPSGSVPTIDQVLCPAGVDNGGQFQYNAIGQMTSEAQGSNVLNVTYTAYGLTKEVRNGSNQLMETFRYDDRGNRIAATTYDAGLPVKTTYYVSDANGSVMSIYDQDLPSGTPRQIELPIYGSGRIGEYKPVSNKMFYELTDHLGNVRAVMGPSYTEAKTATLEISQANEDQSNFLRYQNAQFVNARIFDHTHRVNSDSSSYSQRLTGGTNDIYGLARSLNVMPGDTINAEVYAKYVDPTTSNLNGALSTLMGLITSPTSSLVTEGTSFATSTSSFGLADLLTHTDNGEAPKAYLNWLIFDKNYKFITGGFQQLTDAAKVDSTDNDQERVYSPPIIITQPGYAYIYLSNESPSPTEVYFDDFKVTQSHSVYVAGGDYYPFGLQITDRQMDAESYRFGYQGQFAEKDSLARWNRFQLRMYEPKFGRWLSPDPNGQYASPYVAMGNNPVNGTDPDGGFFFGPGDEEFIAALRAAGIGVSEEVTFIGSRAVYAIEGSLAYLTQDLGRGVFQGYNPEIQKYVRAESDIDGTTYSTYENAQWVKQNDPVAEIRQANNARIEFVNQYENVIKETTLALAAPEDLILSGAVKVGGPIVARLGRVIPKVVRITKTSTIIPRTVGAASRGFSKVLQTGGHTLNNSTLKALGLTKEQGKRAIEALKAGERLPSNFHGKIMGNGDLIDPHTGEVLGNLFDYLY